MYTEIQIREMIAAGNGRGIAIPGISNEDYHKGPGESSSDIKTILKGTIKKWQWKKQNPTPQTPDQKLGTMTHTYNLEFKEFWSRYYKSDDIQMAPGRGTKPGKDAFEDWRLSNPDLAEKYADGITSDQWKTEYAFWMNPELRTKEFVEPNDLKIIQGITTSIEKHPVISLMFNKADCQTELSLYWICPFTKILCKCRPDILNFKWPCILDIKTCQDASFDAFEGNVTDRMMHVSAAWYLWGAEMVFGIKFDDFIYLPCEKSEPYEVTYYPADEGSLDIGSALCKAGLRIIERYRKEEKTNTGYSTEVKRIGLRPYGFNKLDQIIFVHDLQGMGIKSDLGVG